MKNLAILILIIFLIIVFFGVVDKDNRYEDEKEYDDLTIKQPVDLRVEYIGEGLEAKELKIIDKNEVVHFEITIEAVNQWMLANKNVFDEIPEVGGRPVNLESFGFFDGGATISPDNKKLAFSIHDYAILTTTSFVMIAEIETGEISVIKQPSRGSVESMIWSPNSNLLAYTLGTARSGGDFLSVDDTQAMNKVFTLEEDDILSFFENEYQNGDGFMPGFRELEWKDDRLQFITDTPDGETKTWSVNFSGDDLRME